jgi:5-formyltetrahydrofolate cyclo-ligase
VALSESKAVSVMQGELAVEKQRLREAIRARRRMIGEQDRAQWSARITEAILAHRCWREAGDVAGFVGRLDEPDTMALLRDTINAGKRLWLPKVIGVDPPAMQWVRALALSQLTPGPFGILEPVPPPHRASGRVDAFDLVVVPGLAFSRQGARIGAGFGYYDRALDTIRASPAVFLLGVCFSEFLDPQEGPIPLEAHDICVHAVCTQDGMVECVSPRGILEGPLER